MENPEIFEECNTYALRKSLVQRELDIEDVENSEFSLKSWGWAFEFKFDSLPRLDFKEVVCISYYLGSSSSNRAYKIEP